MMLLGNWKMNQGLTDIELYLSILEKEASQCKAHVVGIAPQSIHLSMILAHRERVKGHWWVGAQNSASHHQGAYTGEVSPVQLKELGVDFVLVGHSERRQLFGETLQDVASKLKCLLDVGLRAVLCVGETLEEREKGMAKAVVEEQLLSATANLSPNLSIEDLHHYLIVAYEPVWAIGTGKSASPQDAQEMHAHIQHVLNKCCDFSSATILYGGSVNGGNAASLLSQPSVHGALVGGASLKASDFLRLSGAI